MKLPIILATLLAAACACAQDNATDDRSQPFRLAPGDFRWIPFTIRQAPAEVEGHFEVLQGDPSVHVELLPLNQIRLFNRGLAHDSLAITPESRAGDFRRIVEASGRYAVVVVNGKGAPPATVSLRLRTATDLARTLSPERRLTVILLSFAFFFVTVSWSARKLIRGMRPR